MSESSKDKTIAILTAMVESCRLQAQNMGEFACRSSAGSVRTSRTSTAWMLSSLAWRAVAQDLYAARSSADPRDLSDAEARLVELLGKPDPSTDEGVAAWLDEVAR